MTTVVGISGASRAGKTSLCNLLKDNFTEKSVRILHMDQFVFPEDQIPKIKDEIDWERPESVDYKKLNKAIEDAKGQNDLILVEGILIFYDNQLESIYDRKIFIEIDFDTFWNRKKEDKRWAVPDWFIQHIWDSYLRYGLRNSENSLRISGKSDYPIDDIKEFILPNRDVHV